MDPWQKKLTFGKFKGHSFGWVAIYEPAYWSWLVRRCDCVGSWLRKMRKRYEEDEDSDDTWENFGRNFDPR